MATKSWGKLGVTLGFENRGYLRGISDSQIRTEQAMNKIRASFSKTGAHAKKETSGIANSFGNISFKKMLVGTLGLYSVMDAFNRLRRVVASTAASFVDAASKTEQWQLRLKVLLGSSALANKMFRDMKVYASQVPFELEHVMEAATSLAGVMRGGVSEVARWMPLMGDLAAATGFTLQETLGQFIRMYSAGAQAADRFRERGILAMLGFKAGVSYTAKETREQLMSEWDKTNSKFRGATDELRTTWSGLISVIKDKWFILRDELMRAGLFDWMKEQVTRVDAAMNKMLSTVTKGLQRGRAIERLVERGVMPEGELDYDQMVAGTYSVAGNYSEAQIKAEILDASVREGAAMRNAEAKAKAKAESSDKIAAFQEFYKNLASQEKAERDYRADQNAQLLSASNLRNAAMGSRLFATGGSRAANKFEFGQMSLSKRDTDIYGSTEQASWLDSWGKASNEVQEYFSDTADRFRDMQTDMIYGWAGTFENYLLGNIKSFKDVVIGIFKDIYNSFANMMAQMAAEWVFQNQVKPALGSALDIAGGLFGMGSSSTEVSSPGNYELGIVGPSSPKKIAISMDYGSASNMVGAVTGNREYTNSNPRMRY